MGATRQNVSGRHSQTTSTAGMDYRILCTPGQLGFQHHSSHVTDTQAGKDRGPIASEFYFPVPYCPRRTTLEDLQPALWEAEHRLLTSHHSLTTGPGPRNGPCLASPRPRVHANSGRQANMWKMGRFQADFLMATFKFNDLSTHATNPFSSLGMAWRGGESKPTQMGAATSKHPCPICRDRLGLPIDPIIIPFRFASAGRLFRLAGIISFFVCSARQGTHEGEVTTTPSGPSAFAISSTPLTFCTWHCT